MGSTQNIELSDVVTLTPATTLRPSDLARLWDKIDKRGPDACWPWTGACFSAGYGSFSLGGSSVGAHRIVCAMWHGLAAGRFAIHSCDNPPCCNPAHLRWGTHAENMEDRGVRGRHPIGRQQGDPVEQRAAITGALDATQDALDAREPTA
jgi:hypothetical protein